MTRDPDIAWAAGFFDGEGTITISHGTRRGWRNGTTNLLAIKQATVAGEIPEVLQRFHRIVGAGRIGGPYSQRSTSASYNPNQRPTFMWYVSSRAEVRAVLGLLLPELTGVKRSQAEASLGIEQVA